MIVLGEELKFPELHQATEDGLLAICGDLSVERLLLAYKTGIFPWYEENQPLLWWSPDPRFVLLPNDLKISKSMKQVMKNCNWQVTVNKDFNAVITACSKVKRSGQMGTWITKDMVNAYKQLYNFGYAKSVEVWDNNKLIAGLYGVDLGNGIFCGESMFTKISNASKAGFISFVQNSDYKLIDCQVYTSHLESLGAKEISRQKFLEYL